MDILPIVAVIEPPKKKRVSYSQFSNWFNCRHRWYLDNVKKLKKYEDSINTCFGTAIHEAVQLYIETLYTQGAPKADEHDLYELFKVAFRRELDNAVENSKKGKKTSTEEVATEDTVEVKLFEYTEEQFKEFTNDATNILDAFLNITNRMKHFPSGKFEFLAVEDEIQMGIKNNVEFIGFIDVVLFENVFFLIFVPTLCGSLDINNTNTTCFFLLHYQSHETFSIRKI